jgi:ABC-type bacteriocin/lantibiotic exporter with double-glycine peptidase domain
VFALIAVGAALINFTQLTAFTLPGSRLTSKLRARCFASMLRQPIGFFDRKVGTRTTRPPTHPRPPGHLRHAPLSFCARGLIIML